MKSIILKTSMLVVLLLAYITVSAYDFEVNGLYYNVVSLPNLTCEVTSGDVEYTGDIVIPSEVVYNNRTLAVVAIGSKSFSNCFSLNTVTIPEPVTSIGENAFNGCSSLKSIVLPNTLESIYERAFYECSSLTSIIIPGSVTYMQEYVFGFCSSLESIKILSSKNTLYATAFCESYLAAELLNFKSFYINRDVSYDAGGSYNVFCHVEDLILGSNVSNFISLSYMHWDDLKVITCYSADPPRIGNFSNANYINCIVKVPYEALEAYQQADGWKNFWNLEGFDASGVEDVKEEPIEKMEIGRYDLNGRQISDEYNGIFIVRYSDGSAKKQLGHRN